MYNVSTQLHESSGCTTFIFYMYTQINFQTFFPLQFHNLTNKTQDNQSTTEEVISGRPVAYSTPIPSEVLSESDDDLIFMGMDTGDSADVDTANDVIIIHEEDIQKPSQKQKQEASKKTEEQAATPVQEQGEGKPPQTVHIRRNHPLQKDNQFFKIL